ncbi:MAG: ABC transporter substrate-binding protein [Candidatus Tectomicrobia bacterium]|uniref:ABC transporter substrate-binding protein n=1 Tax=Tectimicrobiota bacterium TaxID=2528274 RepID=A0A938B3A9_UNCTE|nr:ABC transporter substrate-binding protein [Candidatus Tectomicrobia bacterium]
MELCTRRKRRGWASFLALLLLPVAAIAQQASKKSDTALFREGPAALAAAHGEKPRYGGKLLSAGVEAVPLYDMHQTSFGGVYAATAPAYNCLVRTSPYDPMALEIFPELAASWEVSPNGQTVTFHLHKGVKWHDGAPFSSADVLYTIERIMRPPQGMVSPRGPVFNALIERVEAPDAHTVVVHGKGPSGLLLALFANGWNVIIPKHIAEKDPVNALKTQVIGTGPFKLKEPPTTALWQYERNPEYFVKGLPYLDALEIHLITDPQALATAMLSKRVFWTNSYVTSTLDRDIAQSLTQQNANLLLSKVPSLAISYLSMHTGKAPFDDVRVRQAISEGLQREALSEFGKQTGVVGTGTYPAGPWAMPQAMREQLIGYGPDMAKRTARAKALLAAYEQEKGKIDWSKIKLQCSTNLPITCDNAQVLQQLLKKIGVNLVLEPMLLAQHRGNEVSGDYVLSTLLAGFDFDDPIDVFGQLYVSKGGRWYQRSSVPELDALFEQQKFIVDPEARKKVINAMDTLAMNDAAFLVLQWVDAFHVRWNFVKGWTATPNARSTNARLDYLWMDLPELPHERAKNP